MRLKQTVLVVEDEPINRIILKKMLGDDYVVIEAADGAEAFAFLKNKQKPVSAILLDIVMPVMDGYEFLAKLREALMTDIPVIVTTGIRDKGAEQKALELGAWDFVSKPYNAKVLLSRLRNAITRSKVTAFEGMQYLSEHDELTGLFNRSKMFSNTRDLLNDNPDVEFAFIRIDIDRFALFNTSFGEEAGDELLRYFADCVQYVANTYKLSACGRMNADVFCVCCEYDGDAESLKATVDTIQHSLEEYRRDYRLETSTGVCVIDDRSLEIDEYYLRASLASQKCKNQYDTHVAFYDDAAGRRLSAELAIANEMQTALDEGQFVVYLQPKFNLATESVCGAEALVRWRHPKKGLVMPGEFIPVFESNGFISKMDYCVWEQTCKMLAKWQDSGLCAVPVSVNISRVSMYNPNLAERMTALVHKYGVPASLLQLEVTESAYMTNPDLMEKTIKSLHDAGFTILMDDFGSGYSSLNTLKRIKVDVLKVDMKFLPVKDDTDRGEIILASVIRMANWLGMRVVVEGVETRRQRDFLEGAGCDSVQGYYYSRPVPCAEFEKAYLAKARAANTKTENASVSISNERDTTPRSTVILLIGDSEDSQALLTECFGGKYYVHVCRSAESALAYLKRSMRTVRLIVIESDASGMGTMELLRYCMQDSTLAVIPKLVLTKNGSDSEHAAAFSEGAFDYMARPLVPEVFAARVKHILEIGRRTSVFDTVEHGYKQKTEIDTATGLLNKIAFRGISERIMEALPDDREAMIVLDIDDLSGINRRLGLMVGDEAIRCTAKEILNTFRKTDVMGYFGGDEFVVLMTKLSSATIAKRKAHELIKAVMFACANRLHIQVGVSAGVAISEQNDTVDSLYARAERALLKAKRTGKSKAVIYGENVLPVINDDKPIVLLCGDTIDVLTSIALAYDNSAAFLNASDAFALRDAFESYSGRISAICVDVDKIKQVDFCEFYDVLMENGGGMTPCTTQRDITQHESAQRDSALHAKTGERSIPILAVCKEGAMGDLREALKLDVFDVLTLPPHMGAIQRRLSRAIIAGHRK